MRTRRKARSRIVWTALGIAVSSLLPISAFGDAVVSPALDAAMRSHPSETLRVWVFFRDRGDAPLGVEVSPRSSARRMSRGSAAAAADERNLAVHPHYIRAVAETGCTVRHVSRYLNAVSAIASRDQVMALRAVDGVSRIGRVARYRRPLDPPEAAAPAESPAPVAPASDDYGASRRQVEQAGVIPLHDDGWHGEGVLVALLDSGFKRTHEALDHIDVVAEYDFVFDDSVTSNEAVDASSQHVHGTNVLSTIAGHAPGDLIGPAWAADFVLAKTERILEEVQGEEDDFVRALEWADSIGVDVVSASLGYFDWYDYPDVDGNTAVTTIACDIAASRGIVVVASAGNQGGGALDWPGITPPADGDSVIAVGAVDSVGAVARFSSHGPTFDGRVKPDVMAMGVDVLVASSSVDTVYYRADGTSFSAPLVAGACALLLQVHPAWGPAEVLAALRSEASNAASPDNAYGWGVIDAYQSATNGATGVLSGVTIEARRVEEGIAVGVKLAGSGAVTVDLERRRRASASSWGGAETIAAGVELDGGSQRTVVDRGVSPGVYEYRVRLASDPSQVSPWRPVVVPFELSLAQSAPNPFDMASSTVTKITFTIAGAPGEASLDAPERQRAEVSIYDVRGARVRTLFARSLVPGDYTTEWDGLDERGAPVASGVYFYRLGVGSRAMTRKILLLRP